MSTTDTRFSALIEQFTGSLQSPDEDVRRKATDDLYERIIAQYADVSSVMISREKNNLRPNKKLIFRHPLMSLRVSPNRFKSLFERNSVMQMKSTRIGLLF